MASSAEQLLKTLLQFVCNNYGRSFIFDAQQDLDPQERAGTESANLIVIVHGRSDQEDLGFQRKVAINKLRSALRELLAFDIRRSESGLGLIELPVSLENGALQPISLTQLRLKIVDHRESPLDPEEKNRALGRDKIRKEIIDDRHPVFKLADRL